jgi:hypothetical protein
MKKARGLRWATCPSLPDWRNAASLLVEDSAASFDHAIEVERRSAGRSTMSNLFRLQLEQGG